MGGAWKITAVSAKKEMSFPCAVSGNLFIGDACMRRKKEIRVLHWRDMYEYFDIGSYYKVIYGAEAV